MSYQVLARKWRPKNFKQMVGQEHVLQALVHALESQRIHHAYLFTGTRGVGKTTIARILARCLSCENGITAEPCGQCGSCLAIEQGRYVDLIEIDAASRTKVEDMRELLENVQYAPTSGRFKIYLIDEVHMLSTHSFNALLKTLEEPPEHVKFLFATTDPQKLPVTILSRCLQFNLKNMTPEKIVSHLEYVLSEERVQAEHSALWALARAADGSMRDALSLTDQAIAYTKGAFTESAVTAMLGTVDQKKVYRLLDTLVARDPKALIGVVSDIAEFAPNYASILESIVSIFHRVAIEQAVPGATDNSQGDQERICFYAQNLSAEDVQLYYQIALVSRKDLAITPDARAGFEMALLRMMSFQMEPLETIPQTDLAPEVDASQHQEHHDQQHAPESLLSEKPLTEESATRGSESVETEVSDADHFSESEAQLVEEKKTPELAESPSVGSAESSEASEPLANTSAPTEPPSSLIADDQHELVPLRPETQAQDVVESSIRTADKAVENALEPKQATTGDLAAMDWPRQAIRLGLNGMALNLLMNMVKKVDGSVMTLAVETGHFRLLNDSHKNKIRSALQDVLEWDGKVEFVEGLDARDETPAMWRERMNQEKLDQAKHSLRVDPNVKELIAEFDGRMLEESVVSLSPIE